jgi:preprotein translocase subunit SecE
MNTKVEQQPTPAGGGADIAKLALSFLLLVAGVFAYYWFDQYSPAVRGVAMLGVVVVALALAAFTGIGRTAREFLSESQFELRKVVWPTKQETIQTTIAVGVVVVILSIILWIIDMVLGWAILDHLLRSKNG